MHGQNFLRTMLRLAAERDELTVVGDQLAAPTTTRALADATLKLVQYFMLHGKFSDAVSGVYHMTCGGRPAGVVLPEQLLLLQNIQTPGCLISRHRRLSDCGKTTSLFSTCQITNCTTLLAYACLTGKLPSDSACRKVSSSLKHCRLLIPLTFLTDASSLLGKDGPFAGLLENYRVRESQQQMASRIETGNS